MDEYFSSNIDTYFLNWIKKGTWASKHFYDMERFYTFLKALLRSTGANWMVGFEDNIFKAASKFHGSFTPGYLDEQISYFLEKAKDAEEYEKSAEPNL